MLLESTEVHQFRNLSGKVSWGTDLNIIFGDNGQGKTNWLEAIYFLATTKSFRTQRSHEAILFGHDLTVVRGSIARSREVRRDLQIAIQGNTKTLTINGKREAVARYLGQLHVVAFTADELEVVRGGPEARRRFLDRGVLSLHCSYVQTLADYNRVLKQKNRLLQDVSDQEMRLEDATALISPWNEQLATLATNIHRARSEYVQQLNAAFDTRLFGRETVTIRYLSALEGKGDLSNYSVVIAERLQLRLPAEIAARYALVGPHRDDLEIQVNGHDVRRFGSSGQQRSALILLDLAAMSVYHTVFQEYPLFLIDDVDAELDQKRIDILLKHLEGRTQTFITTSKENLINQYIKRANVYEIKRGAATHLNELHADLDTRTRIDVESQ